MMMILNEFVNIVLQTLGKSIDFVQFLLLSMVSVVQKCATNKLYNIALELTN